MITGGGLNLGRCTFIRRQYKCRCSNCGCVCSAACPSLSLSLKLYFSLSSGPSLRSSSWSLSCGGACLSCLCLLCAFLACRVCATGGVGDRPRLLAPAVAGLPVLPSPVLFLSACLACLIFGHARRPVGRWGGGGGGVALPLPFCSAWPVSHRLLAFVAVSFAQGLASSAWYLQGVREVAGGFLRRRGCLLSSPVWRGCACVA